MKLWKILRPIAICMVLVLFLLPTTANAATVSSGTCGDNVTWTLDDTGTLTISGTGAMYDYGWDDAPWHSSGVSVKKVVIEDGVTTIGDRAFYGYYSEFYISIPSSVTAIGEYAFTAGAPEIHYDGTFSQWKNISFCTFYHTFPTLHCLDGDYNLCGPTVIWELDHAGTLTISGTGSMIHYYPPGAGTFEKFMPSCEKLVIEEGVTTIGFYSFADNGLASVTIPKSVTVIDGCAFSSCDNLRSVTIGTGTATIGDMAFSGCVSLTSVTIPDSVTTIGDYAFRSCTSLTGIWVDANNPNYSSDSNGVLFNKDKTTLIQAPGAIVSYTIPASVTTISEGAFYSCSRLTDVWYTGSQTDRNKISIGSNNEYLTSATWHYNVCSAGAEHTYDHGCDTDCNVCGKTRTATHTYDHGCDTDCNVCGHTRTPEGHKVGTLSADISNASSYPFTLSNGVYKSTNKANNSTATFTITAKSAQTLKIEYYTSTEHNYDKLTIKHNSTTKVTVSGTTSWATLNLNLAVGDKVYITYSKDSSQSSGNDEVYFKLPGVQRPAEEVSPTCDGAVICDVCGVTVKPATGHSYDNACDAACNNCGETRTVPAHVYDHACDTDCNVCGDTRTITHTYDHACDTDCNVCGDTRTTTHTYDNACDAVCNVCSFERTVPAHSYTLNGNHTCDICKYSKTPGKAVVESKTNSSVTLVKTEGFEYSKDGKSWQTSNMFTSLAPGTTYTFYQRVKASSAALVSEISEGVSVTFKSAQTAPAAPSITGFDDTTVMLLPIAGGEYSVDGITWQTDSVFTGLSAGTKYTIYQRYAETATHEASNASSTTVTTDKVKQTQIPAAPTVESVTASSITLASVAGCEYSKNGKTWQASTVFTGLSCGTEYTFYQRYKETATTYAGKSSEGFTVKTDKGTKNRPSAPILASKTYNTVTLVAVSGCEYSRDGINWQTSNVFTGLAPEMNYFFYQRYAETDTYYASAISASLIVKTEEEPVCVTNPAAHIFDNGCDSECNVCGYIRGTSGHIYDNACDADCNECGAKRTIAHNYVDATPYAPKTCTICGATVGSPLTVDYTFTTDEQITLTYSTSIDLTFSLSDSTVAKITKISTGKVTVGASVRVTTDVTVVPLKPGYVILYVCDATGTVRGQECLVIKEGEHRYTLLEVLKEADCVEDGKELHVCEFCGLEKEIIISSFGHTEIVDAAVAPTCVTTGLTEGVHCATCGDVLVAQEIVGVLKHTYGPWEVVKPAQYGIVGFKERVCFGCGAKETEEIPALEYAPGDVDGNETLSTDDAVYLLLSVMFGTEDYPVPDGMMLDFNGDNKVDTDDAVYLLLHVMFGEEDYPLSA